MRIQGAPSCESGTVLDPGNTSVQIIDVIPPTPIELAVLTGDFKPINVKIFTNESVVTYCVCAVMEYYTGLQGLQEGAQVIGGKKEIL